MIPVVQKVIKPALVRYGKRGVEALQNIGIPFFLCLPRRVSAQYVIEQIWKKLVPCVKLSLDSQGLEIANKLLIIRLIGRNGSKIVSLELEEEVFIGEGSSIAVEWDLKAYKTIFSIEKAMVRTKSFISKFSVESHFS